MMHHRLARVYVCVCVMERRQDDDMSAAALFLPISLLCCRTQTGRSASFETFALNFVSRAVKIEGKILANAFENRRKTLRSLTVCATFCLSFTPFSLSVRCLFALPVVAHRHPRALLRAADVDSDETMRLQNLGSLSHRRGKCLSQGVDCGASAVKDLVEGKNAMRV